MQTNQPINLLQQEQEQIQRLRIERLNPSIKFVSDAEWKNPDYYNKLNGMNEDDFFHENDEQKPGSKIFSFINKGINGLVRVLALQSLFLGVIGKVNNNQDKARQLSISNNVDACTKDIETELKPYNHILPLFDVKVEQSGDMNSPMAGWFDSDKNEIGFFLEHEACQEGNKNAQRAIRMHEAIHFITKSVWGSTNPCDRQKQECYDDVLALKRYLQAAQRVAAGGLYDTDGNFIDYDSFEIMGCNYISYNQVFRKIGQLIVDSKLSIRTTVPNVARMKENSINFPDHEGVAHNFAIVDSYWVQPLDDISASIVFGQFIGLLVMREFTSCPVFTPTELLPNLCDLFSSGKDDTRNVYQINYAVRQLVVEILTVIRDKGIIGNGFLDQIKDVHNSMSFQESKYGFGGRVLQSGDAEEGNIYRTNAMQNQVDENGDTILSKLLTSRHESQQGQGNHK